MAEKRYIVEVEKAEEATEGRPSRGPVYRSLFAKDGFPAPVEGLECCWDVFRMSVQKYPTSPMLGRREIVDGKAGKYKWLTYKEVYDLVIKVGNSIRFCGYGEGVKCGIYGSNSAEWIMSMEACNAHGLYCVPLYDTLGAGAIEFIICHAEVSIAFVEEKKIPELLKTFPNATKHLKTIVSFGKVTPEQKQEVEKFGLAIYSWDEFLQVGQNQNYDLPIKKRSDICTIMYTSGTTGDPKGVLISNESIITLLAGVKRLLESVNEPRMGIIAAGCYGLPQFRLRVFLWGAHPSEVIPQFPLPTHDVIVRYWPPPEFERNVVAYDEDQPRELEKATVIQDAISDLPAVKNSETREEMPYRSPPETEFQRYIRSTKYEMTGSKSNETKEKRPLLYDHRPHTLSEDDHQRVSQIPKRKGANFRDLPGVIVGADNVVRRHPTENPMLPSGKPLIPDYCFTFEQGKSKRPFARLWWDENLPTALTFPSCHNQVVLHPEQDRVLTIREFARLQGFPDYYRFHGTAKKRYCQIGNAVAVSVSRALGYTLGLACRKLSGNEPLVALPPNFSHSHYLHLSDNEPANTH